MKDSRDLEDHVGHEVDSHEVNNPVEDSHEEGSHEADSHGVDSHEEGDSHHNLLEEGEGIHLPYEKRERKGEREGKK